MNWRNAFFITLAALIAALIWNFNLRSSLSGHDSQVSEMEPAQVVVEKDGEMKVDVVEASVALANINAYHIYLERVAIKDSIEKARQKKLAEAPTAFKESKGIPLDSIPQIVPNRNRKIREFKKIEKQELRQMLEAPSRQDSNYVYIELALLRNHENPAEAMIDMYFKVHTCISPDSDTTVDSNGFRYYDFATPCPPLCDEQ